MAVRIADRRWNGDLDYLQIPVAERPRWQLAPAWMNYEEAQIWAIEMSADKILPLATGETLLRLPPS